MKKEEALDMLKLADRSDKLSAINKSLTRKQSVEIIEKAILSHKDGEELGDMFEKRVYQVCKNQRRPNIEKYRNRKIAICVGCGKTAGELEEYDDNNPVEEDGTYQDGKFVCTNCYVKLIDLGLDIGSPSQIQQNIRELKK